MNRLFPIPWEDPLDFLLLLSVEFIYAYQALPLGFLSVPETQYHNI